METQDQSTTHVGQNEGRALWVLGELVTYKVTSEQTGGAYSLFEIASQPQGGPPPHVQRHEDEWFYVLEGSYEFFDEGRTFVTGPGSLVYVPKGRLHTYRNVGEDAGRMLVSQTPGGLHERFFEELGEEAVNRTAPPAMDSPPDVGRIVAIAEKYGIKIPPPPA